MATITILEKIRQGRIEALSSLETKNARKHNVISLFGTDLDMPRVQKSAPNPTGSNVIAFRVARPAAARTAQATAQNVVAFRHAA